MGSVKHEVCAWIKKKKRCVNEAWKPVGIHTHLHSSVHIHKEHIHLQHIV